MPDEIFQDFWSSIIAPREDLFFAKDVVIPSLVDEIPDQTFYRNDNINTLTKRRTTQMALPQDPMMLLSYINTQLRDEYDSLDELCSSIGADKDEICRKLETADYFYDQNLNKFV